MNLLFICTLNQWRSPTAEHIYCDVPGLSVRSAGTAKNARHHVNASDLQWAEIIFVMERKHKEYLEGVFSNEVKYKKVVNLNIPDGLEYMDPDLIEMLKLTVGEHLSLS